MLPTFKRALITLTLILRFSGAAAAEMPDAALLGVHEVELRAAGEYTNAYVELEADVVLMAPGGRIQRRAPLFWDGGAVWKFRFSPDVPGEWTWVVQSRDSGLNGKKGVFRAVAAGRRGTIRPMRGFPDHFERQDGTRFWFMGDTAWALFTDNEKEKHDRAGAEAYLKARAAQGFNVIHSMLLSEAGWGNRGGLPFDNLREEKLNPEYWREVDHRLGYANDLGLVCGVAAAWGDKRDEPYAWRKFPSLEARRRYARYVAARYAAFDVYFIVSGEWHAEIGTRRAREESVQNEFIELGEVMRANDPHQRMMAIHPMHAHGSVREFNRASWMSFGDYQQNYDHLHSRLLESRRFHKPVVNSEYGYFLRDQNGDGVPDKENSTSLEVMRHATWDIVMAGGYVVTGFGTTYFGGNRDPGPFNLTAEKNRLWEEQIGHIKRLFAGMEWWKLEPHDELLHCAAPRGRDRAHLKRVAPPEVAYWCLAEPERQYVLYVRGVSEPVKMTLGKRAGELKPLEWNLRTGKVKALGLEAREGQLHYTPPDAQDWVVIVTAP